MVYRVVRSFHQGAEWGTFMPAKNELSLPSAGNNAVGHFLRPLFDREHLRYFAAHFLVVSALRLSPACALLPLLRCALQETVLGARPTAFRFPREQSLAQGLDSLPHAQRMKAAGCVLWFACGYTVLISVAL